MRLGRKNVNAKSAKKAKGAEKKCIFVFFLVLSSMLGGLGVTLVHPTMSRYHRPAS
jgi:hypothetical protein